MDFSQLVRNRLARTITPGALGVLSALLTAGPASGAVSALYENNAPVVAPPAIAPQINATIWVNRSTFDIFGLTGLPFESQNTSFFTNTTSGRMSFDPGVRFFRNTGGQRLWMTSWVNDGVIATDHDSFFAGTFFSDSRASILQVAANSIISRGPLSSGAAGLVRLEGNTITVPRIGIRTGPALSSSGAIFGTSFLGSSNYQNDVGVTDVYWGGGTNNSVRNQGPMLLDPFTSIPHFDLPIPSSPFHDVISRSTLGTLFTNQTRIPGSFFFFGTNILGSGFVANGFDAAVHTSPLNATSRVVQVVFYPTNSDPLFRTEVRFVGGSGLSDVIVGFHASDFDIATQVTSTNSVYLVDGLPTSTNVFFARNLAGSTRRPSTFEVTRSTPFGYFSSVPTNATFSSNMIVGAQYQRRAVTNLYAAYAAQIAGLGSSQSGSIPYDVTNVPGRVDIIGDQVNMEQTRIRSESALVVKIGNLVSNRLARIDAPLIDFDVGSTQPVLTISNLAPATVRRFAGSLQAWSGTWQNDEVVTTPATGTVTNTVFFHVLIVDSQLQGTVPVVLNRFAVRGQNHVVNDLLNIAKSIRVEGDSLHLTAGLNTPFGYSLGATNLIGLRHFTNDGTIIVSGVENFGADRPDPYLNFVNRGTNSAYTMLIESENVDNPGYLRTLGGPLTINATTLGLGGVGYAAVTNIFTNLFFQFPAGTITNITTNVVVVSSPSTLESISDVRLNVADLTASNSWINAGALVLNVTDNLIDGGQEGINTWNVANGFQVVVKPAFSSTLGTHVRSTVAAFGSSAHNWTGDDMGASAAGYANNLALGKLTLDGGENALFVFSPVDTRNAIYVDYLELLNSATNYNVAFAIDPNFTIYYANANVSVEKLDNALGGRFRWVPDFAGPLSSTNIFYETTGQTYTFNSALVNSKDLDSDGDGIVNAMDPEPLYVPENAAIALELANSPTRGAILRWSALANSLNTIEYKSAPNQGSWQVLTNFVHGPQTSPVSIFDPLPSNGASRVYRLRVDPTR